MNAAPRLVRGTDRGVSPGDAECFVRVRDGDLGALGVLYDRYHGDVAALVARAGVPDADLEDAVHETFLTLVACAADYDGRASARPWILGIAWRVAAQRRRSLRRWIKALVGFGSHPVTPLEDPESVAVRGERRAAFDRALGALPAKMRAVVLLVEVEGLSGEEAGRALGIPTATVWTRLHHARKRLAALLDPTEGGP